MKKCYKQTCIALAIKKVRLCRSASDAANKIFTETVKTKKAFKGMNARNANYVLYGQAICKIKDFSATSSALLLKFTPI